MKSKKVILDTNLWISFLISKDLKFIDAFIDNGQIKLIFSEELIEEFLTVATRPKFERYFPGNDIKLLLSKFDLYGRLIKVTSEITICRDKKDNFLLCLAVDSKADFLVTGDSDLLEIRRINKTKIITFKELEEILK